MTIAPTSDPGAPEPDATRSVSLGDGVIFLLGLPRSGTTLLQRLLGQHHSIHTVAEPWLMLPLAQLLSDRLGEAEYDSSLAAQALDGFALELPGGRGEIVDGIRRLAVDLYASCRRPSGARYFLDKTPRYHHIVPELAELLPDAQFIVLRRNPLSILASVSEAWFGGDVAAALTNQHHRHDLTAGFAHLDAAPAILGERACSIRYESLVADTEHELRRLCTFLDIEFDEAMLGYDPDARYKGSFGDSIGVPQHRSATSDSVDKWQTTILRPANVAPALAFLRDTPATSFHDVGLDRDTLIEQLERAVADGPPAPGAPSPSPLPATPPVGTRVARGRRAAGRVVRDAARFVRRDRPAPPDRPRDGASEPVQAGEPAVPSPLVAAGYQDPGERLRCAREIGRAFEVALGRAPTAPELTQWMTRVDDGFMPWDVVASLSGEQDVRATPAARDAAVRSMLSAAYRRYLQREPADDEVDARIADLNAGSSPWALLESIVGSPEAARRRAELERARLRTLWLGFEVALGRMPSDAEMAHWSALIDEGFMPWDLVASLRTGAEVRAAPTARDEAVRSMVQAAYGRFLHRDPADDEVAVWLSGLAAGRSPWLLLEAIAGSDDAQRARERAARRDDGEQLARLRSVWVTLEVALRRMPVQAELAHWSARIDDGLMPWDILASVATGADVRLAPEQRDEAIGDLVRAGYHRFLHRPPSDADVATWRADIAAGRSPWALLESIADSAEGATEAGLERLPPALLAAAVLEPLYGRGLTPAELAEWKHTLDRRAVGRVEFVTSATLDHIRKTVHLRDAPPLDADPQSVPIMGTTRMLTPEAWQARARELAAQPPAPASRRASGPYLATGEPRVSVIASLYRGGRYIERFLDMITSQTVGTDAELIIVDAQSPEGERAVIERYQSSHPNIVYRRTDRRVGIYEAWNIGVELARGEYLTNANMDDIRSADSLQLQAEVLDRYPWVDVVYQDFFYTLDDTLDFETIARFGFRSDLPIVTPANLMQYNSPHNAPMWRKQLHQEVGLFDQFLRSAGDYEFWMRCAARGKVFFKLNEPHVAYFQNPIGMSTQPDGPGYEEGMRSLRKHAGSLVSPLMFADDETFRAQLESWCGVPVGEAASTRFYDLAQRALESCWRVGAPSA